MDLLTVQETAKRLKVNPVTIRRYIAAGRLAAVRVGKGIRVRPEAVEALLTPIDDTRSGQTTQVGRALSYDDPLWRLVGSAIGAPPTDAARKHEHLADALAPDAP